MDFFRDGDNTSLNIGGSEFADALMVTEALDEKVSNFVKKSKGKPILRLENSEATSLPLVSDFYKNILAN